LNKIGERTMPWPETEDDDPIGDPMDEDEDEDNEEDFEETLEELENPEVEGEIGDAHRLGDDE
jgi:hypothetical protein